MSIKQKLEVGRRGSHYDAWLVGGIIIVAFVIILFAYGQTIVDAIEAVKSAVLSVFGI